MRTQRAVFSIEQAAQRPARLDGCAAVQVQRRRVQGSCAGGTRVVRRSELRRALGELGGDFWRAPVDRELRCPIELLGNGWIRLLCRERERMWALESIAASGERRVRTAPRLCRRAGVDGRSV